MQPFVRNFIRSSLVWIAVGGLMGLGMIFWPAEALAYRPAHVHANLLGFVSMMIFGVAYHVMPRFSGRPLSSRRMARLHLWLANGGLALMVAGWGVDPFTAASWRWVLQAGALVSGLGIALFVVNIWRTVGGPPVGIDVPGPLTKKRPKLVRQQEKDSKNSKDDDDPEPDAGS